MLDKINERDVALQHIHRDLENRVLERTKDLEDEVQVRQAAEKEIEEMYDQLKETNNDLELAIAQAHEMATRARL